MAYKLKISKAEAKWYGSKEHFRTEKSYEEHLEDLKKKKSEYGTIETLPHNKKLVVGEHGKLSWVSKETGVWD